MDSRRTAAPGRTAALLLVALAWALFLTLIGSPEALLFTVPVFLLAAPLAFDRYVGEKMLTDARRPRFRGVRGSTDSGLPAGLARLATQVEFGCARGRGPPARVPCAGRLAGTTT